MVGDYTAEPFSPQVKHNAVCAIASMYAALGKDPSTLRLHHEDPATTHKDCPGKNVVKADMIQAITAQIASMHPGEHAVGATG